MNAILEHLKAVFPGNTHRRIFLVGGAVRDLLLGRERRDCDLAAALSDDEFARLGFRFVEGKSTASIWFRHDDTFGTIEALPLPDAAGLTGDLKRRDFTVNAMAMTLTGEIIDPLGGRSDMKLRRLAPCTRRTFSDDFIRVYRAFRFAADGWHLTHECNALLGECALKRDFCHLPVERFSREMLKALSADHAGHFFELMLHYDIGREYLPELFRMPQVPAGPPTNHPEGDLLTHSIRVLQGVATATGDPLARFCALFHDIGKLSTDPALYPRHHGHDLAGFRISIDLCRRLRLPARYGTALAWVSRLHGSFNRWDQLRDATRIRVAGQALKAGIAEILPLVSAADKAGSSELREWREALRIAGMATEELGIDLQVLEGVTPSKRPAYILQKRVEMLRLF